MKLEFKTTFQKKLKKLNKKSQQLIANKLRILLENQETLDIKKIQPKSANLYRLRAGNYRLIFSKEKNTTIFIDMNRRDSIYKKLFSLLIT
jgi:mRNA-degrading endonuclease RelE of RelBE toxin-antitoxin system